MIAFAPMHSLYEIYVKSVSYIMTVIVIVLILNILLQCGTAELELTIINCKHTLIIQTITACCGGCI